MRTSLRRRDPNTALFRVRPVEEEDNQEVWRITRIIGCNTTYLGDYEGERITNLHTHTRGSGGRGTPTLEGHDLLCQAIGITAALPERQQRRPQVVLGSCPIERNSLARAFL